HLIKEMAEGVRDGRIFVFLSRATICKLFCNRLQRFETVCNNLGGQIGFGNSLKPFATLGPPKTSLQAAQNA
ncbi:MAG: hypothetical protein WA634_08085, partial [Silvibacterium sp.]